MFILSALSSLLYLSNSVREGWRVDRSRRQSHKCTTAKSYLNTFCISETKTKIWPLLFNLRLLWYLMSSYLESQWSVAPEPRAALWAIHSCYTVVHNNCNKKYITIILRNLIRLILSVLLFSKKQLVQVMAANDLLFIY